MMFVLPEAILKKKSMSGRTSINLVVPDKIGKMASFQLRVNLQCMQLFIDRM